MGCQNINYDDTVENNENTQDKKRYHRYSEHAVLSTAVPTKPRNYFERTFRFNPPVDRDHEKFTDVINKDQTEYRDSINNQEPTTDELWNIITTLEDRKAPGHNGTTNTAIKHLTLEAVDTLKEIINAIIRHQYYPKTWKHTTIIIIYKLGKPNNKADGYSSDRINQLATRTQQNLGASNRNFQVSYYVVIFVSSIITFVSPTGYTGEEFLSNISAMVSYAERGYEDDGHIEKMLTQINDSHLVCEIKKNASRQYIGCDVAFDSVLCWPQTPPNTLAVLPCFSQLNGIHYDTRNRLRKIMEGFEKRDLATAGLRDGGIRFLQD
ncbi:GPRDIH1 [Trypoxylus dichotomus]